MRLGPVVSAHHCPVFVYLMSAANPPSKLRHVKWAVVVVVLFLFAYGLWIFVDEMRTQATLGPEAEARIAAKITGSYVRLDGKLTEVMTILSIERHGAAAKAGFREDDIIVDDLTIGDVYRKLSGRSGASVTFHVVPGGDGPPLSHRKRRKVVLILP